MGRLAKQTEICCAAVRPPDDTDFWLRFIQAFQQQALLFLPVWRKEMGGMAKLVSSVCFWTNTLLVESIYWWTEIKPMKLIPSLWCLTLSHCNSLMGKWHLNLLCSPESAWPEVAEGREPLALPWCWEHRRDLLGGSERELHTRGSKKLEYIIESCPGRSRICQETRSQETYLDPFLHLTINTSYRIFPRSQQHVLGRKPQHSHAADSVYSGIQGYPSAHKRAACFLMVKHFL